jgi:hypothetical protein
MRNSDASPRRMGSVVRWVARGLSLLVMLLWGFFIIAHLFGSEEAGNQPLSPNDYIQLVLMGTWLLGLLLAWKWELAGGIIILSAYVVFGFINVAAFTMPFPFLAIIGMLFLLSWWINRPST